MNLNDLLAQGQRELEELRERERLEAEQRQQAELAETEARRQQTWLAEVKGVLPQEAWPYIVVPISRMVADRINVVLDAGLNFFPIVAHLRWQYDEDATWVGEGHLVLDGFTVPWRSLSINSYVFQDHGSANKTFITTSFPLALAVAKERWAKWKADEAQEVMDARLPLVIPSNV